MKTTLPSGREVEMKEVSLTGLLHLGKIPNPLLPIVRVLISGGEMDAGETAESLQTREDFEEYAHFLVEYAQMSLTSPRLSDKPGKGEIGVLDLSDTDYVFIFVNSQIAQKVADAKPFRDKGKSVAAAGDGAPVRGKAK